MAVTIEAGNAKHEAVRGSAVQRSTGLADRCGGGSRSSRRSLRCWRPTGRTAARRGCGTHVAPGGQRAERGAVGRVGFL